MPHRNPDSSAAVSSQSSTNPKLCSPKNAHCRSSKGKKTGAVGFFFFFLIEAGILSPSLLCTTWVQLRRLRPLVAPVSSSAPGWDDCPALIPALIIFKAAGFISHSCRRQWHRSSPRKQLFRLLPLLMRWAETATMDVSTAWTPLKHLASWSDLNLLQTFCTAQSRNGWCLENFPRHWLTWPNSQSLVKFGICQSQHRHLGLLKNTLSISKFLALVDQHTSNELVQGVTPPST